MVNESANTNVDSAMPAGGNPAGKTPSQSAPQQTTVCGIITVILGILALVLSIIPIVNNIAAVFGVIGAVLGIVAMIAAFRGRKRGKALSVVGTALCVLAVVVTLNMQAAASKALDDAFADETNSQQSANGDTASETNGDTAATDDAEQTDASAAQSQQEEVPADWRSALRQATTYAQDMAMSRQGVYDQLVSEYGGQFSAEAAQYAIDHVQADWQANAVQQAKQYEETMAMSPEAIRDQLTSEYGGKFTAEEAQYAIDHMHD